MEGRKKINFNLFSRKRAQSADTPPSSKRYPITRKKVNSFLSGIRYLSFKTTPSTEKESTNNKDDFNDVNLNPATATEEEIAELDNSDTSDKRLKLSIAEKKERRSSKLILDHIILASESIRKKREYTLTLDSDDSELPTELSSSDSESFSDSDVGQRQFLLTPSENQAELKEYYTELKKQAAMKESEWVEQIPQPTTVTTPTPGSITPTIKDISTNERELDDDKTVNLRLT